MTTIEITNGIRQGLESQFPRLTFQIELSESEKDFRVGVFGVPMPDVEKVTEFLLKLDWDLCASEGFVLTPLVRDEKTTAEHYPDKMPSWKPAHLHGAHGLLEFQQKILAERIYHFESSHGIKWLLAPSDSLGLVAQCACSEELALAA